MPCFLLALPNNLKLGNLKWNLKFIIIYSNNTDNEDEKPVGAEATASTLIVCPVSVCGGAILRLLE